MDVKSGMLKIGQRLATGWTDLAALAVKGLGMNQVNSFLVAANGATATLTFGAFSLAYTFAAPLNTAMAGLGTNSSLAAFTSFSVQKLPINFTYSVLEDLSDGVANNFVPQTGTRTTTSGTTGRYYAAPPSGGSALTTRQLNIAPLSYVEYSATVNASQPGVTAGLVFDQTSANDFLYEAIWPSRSRAKTAAPRRAKTRCACAARTASASSRSPPAAPAPWLPAAAADPAVAVAAAARRPWPWPLQQRAEAAA